MGDRGGDKGWTYDEALDLMRSASNEEERREVYARLHLGKDAADLFAEGTRDRMLRAIKEERLRKTAVAAGVFGAGLGAVLAATGGHVDVNGWTVLGCGLIAIGAWLTAKFTRG